MAVLLFAILSSLGSVASLIGLLRDIYKRNEGPRTYTLVGILLLLAALSGFLWNEYNAVAAENTALKLARSEAIKLVNSWPNTGKIENISRGQARGIVLSGLAFLEAHKKQFPQTYNNANNIFNELGVNKNNDKEWYFEIDQLQQAVETMVILIKSIRVQ